MWITKLYDHRGSSLLLTLFWVLVDLGPGVQEYLARQALGYTTALPDTVLWPLIAAVWWIPLTLGIVYPGRRLPLRLPGQIFPWVLHLTASLSASFVLMGDTLPLPYLFRSRSTPCPEPCVCCSALCSSFS